MNSTLFKRHRLAFWAILATASSLLAAHNSNKTAGDKSSRVFKAGAAVSNITPLLDEPIIGG